MVQTSSVVKYPQSILRKRAEEVLSIPSNIQELVSAMTTTMLENDGIGLAAPQINLSQRIIIVQNIQTREDAKKEETPHVFLNPKIIKQSNTQTTKEEGCLSLPGIFVPVKRINEVTLVCQTPEGKEIKVEAKGLAARIFQHEIDHLNGKLIIDKIGFWERFKIRKDLRKFEKTQI